MNLKVFFLFLLGILLVATCQASMYTVDLQGGIGVKVKSPVESNGAIPVNIQDQTTPAFDLFFAQLINRTTLNADAIIDEYEINATTGHGIQVGEQLILFDTTTDRAYVGNVLTSDVNIVTLDTPINTNYSSSTTIISRTTRELNIDGSGTRQTFIITAPIDEKLDITRIMFQMICTTAPEFDDFCDISGGLTKGLVVRVVNGKTTNLFNVKTNGELVNLMYDVNFYDAANPGQGVYGLGGRLTYGGQEKHGVTIRLDGSTGDTLEVIIQDDLTSLESFKMIAAGHIVTD